MTTPDKIYYCYKATNTDNGKIYIGFATEPQKRWRQHKADAIKGRGYIFHQAIRKHGWNKFVFEVICCGLDKRAMLKHVEPALIEQYQSHTSKNGYNMHRKVIGACSREVDIRRVRTLEERQAMSEITKKRFSDDTERQKISNTLKMYFVSIGGSPKKGIRLVSYKPKLLERIKYDPNQSLKNYISTNLINSHGKMKPIYCRISTLQKLGIWEHITLTTSFLGDDSSIAERLYCILHNVEERVKCIVCGHLVSFVLHTRKTKQSGYLRTCSPKCGRKDGDTQYRATSLEKYGVENWKQCSISV